jgi:hypothetical protein
MFAIVDSSLINTKTSKTKTKTEFEENDLGRWFGVVIAYF